MNPIDDRGHVSVQDVASILTRRKWYISGTFLLVVVPVAAITWMMPRQYATHMKILVKNERAAMIVSADGNNRSDVRGEVSEAEINSEIELLASINLLQQVVIKCGLERLEHPGAPVESDRAPLAIEQAVSRLQRDLKVSAVHKANIIQVDYTARDPLLAAAVLRQLADSYLEEHLKVHGTPGTYQFFASQASRYQGELREAEARLEEFRQRENIVMLDQEKEATLRRASDSESALMQVEAVVGEYTRKIADTRHQLSVAPPRVVTQSRSVPNQYSVERLNTMLAELRNRRTDLLAKFRPDDRLVQEASQQIADTQSALEAATKVTGMEQSTDVNPVHQMLELELAKEQSELAGAEARRRTLGQQAQNHREELMRLGNATGEEDDRVRKRKEAEDKYLLYARKAEEARIGESLDQQKIANVAIAETPTVPHLPSKPDVRLNLALGALLAGFLSLGVAFAAEYFSDTVDRPSDLEGLTGLPVLAVARRS
jgi:polysaccharide biosynthesis protein PslE